MKAHLLGSSIAFVLATFAAAASAQNAPPVQGMPPVQSPNAPATQTPVAPPPQAPPPRVPPTYVPPSLPQAPVLQAPSSTPGGTSVRQLGAEGANPSGPTPAAPQIEAQMMALIGRPGGLTADQAAQRARATSYDVQARKAESDAAQTTLDQASLAYVPRIKGTASYTRTSPVSIVFGSFPPFVFPENNYNLQADVDVPLSDYVLKIAKQRSAAEHSAKAAQLVQRAAELTASSNARILYYSWARARLNLVVAQAALDNSRQHLVDARAELAAGKANQADVMGVQAQVAQSELLVTRATNAVALEEDRLRTSLHDGSRQQYEIGEALLADLSPMPGEESFNALFEEGLQHRPELRSITETARGLHLQASAAKFDMMPKLDGIGSAQYANPNPRYFPPSEEWKGTWAVGAALTWTTTDVILGSTNGSVAESRAQSTEAQALQMRDGIRDEVMAAWQLLQEAEVAIKSTQQSLAAEEESYRVRRALFRAERATSTELTDTENALTRARFEAVNARIELRIARVRLAHATGRDDVAAR